MASQQWRELGEGNLHIKSTFSDDSYSIWATDLCQLNVEQLDSDDLRWRAHKDKIPIDLDESHNLSTLLKHLSEAVENGDVSLVGSKTRHLELSTTVRLPKPLPEFQWVFKLELQSEEKFREDVSMPLMSRIQGLEKREKELRHTIHDKDHVISRLLDSLEKTGLDLAYVFPSLASQSSGRRTTTSRTDAESHIPDLRAFEKEPQHESVLTSRPQRKEPDTIETLSVSHPPLPTDASSAPKGIKRTLGSKKPTIADLAPETDTHTTIDGESTEPEQPLVHKPKGIRRTLGRRHISPVSGGYKAGSSPLAQPVLEAHADVSSDVDKEEELERRAHEKRRTLKRELEAAAAFKPKKRKF